MGPGSARSTSPSRRPGPLDSSTCRRARSEKLSQPGGSLYNLEHSNTGLITFPGGIPLKNAEGEVVGAIGVSGSTVENDHTVADAGASTVK